MRYIVCLGDGMSDLPIDELGGKTPLQVAKIPNIDRIVANGRGGLVHTVPQGLNPGSDVANMGILGYDPRQFYTGRGPIEAAAMGIVPPAGQVIFRLNLVTIQNGIMHSFTAGHVENEDGVALLDELNTVFSPDEARFFPGVSYRNIVLLPERYLPLKTAAPHDLTDKSVAAHWPHSESGFELAGFLEKCRQVLSRSPVNQRRVASGKLPVTDVWPWSQGAMPHLPSFRSKFGIGGGIVTAVDLLRGLANLTGLSYPVVPGATGFLDTNYAGKVDAAFRILESEQFAFIHIEAPDECGHLGDFSKKIQAIEDFDRHVVGPVLQYQRQNPETAVVVLPDHPTPCALKTHINAPVPVGVYWPGCVPDNATAYDEESVKKGTYNFQTPWDFITDFLSINR